MSKARDLNYVRQGGRRELYTGRIAEQWLFESTIIPQRFKRKGNSV